MRLWKIILSGGALLLLANCANQTLQPLPTDAVKTAEQAIAIAAKVCKETPPAPGQHWTAILDDGSPVWGKVWHVSAMSDGYGACLQIRPLDGSVWEWDSPNSGYKAVPLSQAKCGACLTLR